MKVIVCGGRDYTNRAFVYEALLAVEQVRPISLLIQGGALGADALAVAWARGRGVPVKTFEADWNAHGRAAGPIRNAAMVAYGADLVIAFPGGRGTADMVRQALAAGLHVEVVA